VDDTLDLSTMLGEAEGTVVYQLTGAIQHEGPLRYNARNGGGHYVADILLNSQWWRFNDSSVQHSASPCGQRTPTDGETRKHHFFPLLLFFTRPPKQALPETYNSAETKSAVRTMISGMTTRASEEANATGTPQWMKTHDQERWEKLDHLLPVVDLSDTGALAAVSREMWQALELAKA
jgi:hypothetical protein